MLKKHTTILTIILYFLVYSAYCQSTAFDNDTVVNDLLSNYFYWSKSEEKKLTDLDKNEKVELLYKMIEYPKDNNDAYFRLFDWLVENIHDLTRPCSPYEYSPIEYAILKEEPVPVKLLLKHTGQIPQTILIPHKCDLKPVSSLYMASEMKDFVLINKMIDLGIGPDSMCYDFWLEHIDDMESSVFFKNYHDTSLHFEKGNILDYILTSGSKFKMDIPYVRKYNDNYENLLEKIITNDYTDIDNVFDKFMTIHLKHEAKKYSQTYPDKKNPGKTVYFTEYNSDKLTKIAALSIIMNNIGITDKLYALPAPSVSRMIDDLAATYISKEMQNWILEKDLLIVNQDHNPFLQVLLVANGVKLKKIETNTRDFLLKGGDIEILAKFYASDQTNSPAVFNSALKKDEHTIMEYISSDKNPFIIDKYGLSLFDVLAFTGMEKPLLKIASENKFLPLDKESLALALLGNNKKIIENLSQKVNMEDYAGYLYDRAIVSNNHKAVEWLASHNYSAENCCSSEDYYYVAFQLLGHQDILKVVLDNGLKNNQSKDRHPLFIFAAENEWINNISLIEFAIANHFDNAFELLYEKFYPKNQAPGPKLLSLAAYTGTTRTTRFLLSKGFSPDIADTSIEGLSPIEIAVFAGNTPVVKTMIESGANYKIRPNPVLKVNDYPHSETFSLADIAGSLSTMDFLQKKGCVSTPVLKEEIYSSIETRNNEKAKQLLQENNFLGADDFFSRMLRVNNVELGIWMLDHYNIAIETHCRNAISDNNKKWFFEACFKHKKYKKALQGFRDDENNTLLHQAVNGRLTEIIKLLLNNGFDPNIANHKNYTPYYLISESDLKGKDEILALMESLGANDKLDQETINNAFADALQSNQVEKVHKYLKLGANPNQDVVLRLGAWNNNVDTVPAIYKAIALNKEAMTELLLLYGADPNAQCEKYGPPLNLALNSYYNNIVRMLVFKGADVNYIPKNNNKNSCEQPLPLIDQMKMKGLDKNGQQIYSSYSSPGLTRMDSLLSKAIVNDDMNKLKELFRHITTYGDYYHSSHIKDTLWSSGSVKMLYYFLQDRKQDFSYDTVEIIRKAAYNKRLDFLESLPPKFFAPVDLTNVYYSDPFISAIGLCNKKYSFNTIYSILSPSQNNIPDTTQATRDLSLKIVQLLDKRIKKSNEERYFFYSIKSRLYEHFAFYLQKQDLAENERTAFLNIVHHHNKALREQLNNGLSPDIHVRHFSLLACAAWANNTEAAKMLLEKGAGVSFNNNDEDYYYKTYLKPAMWAVMLGNEDIIDALIEKGADFSYLGFPNDNIYYASAYTLLMYQKDKWPVLKNLLDKKIIHYSSGNNATTLMTQAIDIDNPGLVNLLLLYPPEESYYLNFKKSYYYAPTNPGECIAYAIKENSEKTFFNLIEKAGKEGFLFKEYYLQNCKNINIIKWLVTNNYGFEDEKTFINLLDVALKNNDFEFFYSVFNTKDSNFVQKAFMSSSSLDRIMDEVYKIESLDILKFIFDKVIVYDKKWLLKALKEDKKSFIRYFIMDLETEWIDYENYKNGLISDQCLNYDTWKYTTQLIIEKEKLDNK